MKKVIDFVSRYILSPFSWTRLKFLLTGREYDLTATDREYLRKMCDQGVFIWVTRRETHLTTHLITFSDWALGLLAWLRRGRKGERPKLGFYAHAFLNTENDTFIEAVSEGVIESYFDNIFNVDAVAALAPKHLTLIEWHMFSKKFVEVATSKKGAQYDTVFDLKDATKVSCIELIRLSLQHCMSDDDYLLRFGNFEALIKDKRNLTPQMLRDCSDFEIVIEMRR